MPIQGPNIMLKRVYAIAMLLAVLLEPAAAQSSREYAIMARSAWSAFECSSLASQMKDPQEQQRLFMYGYKQGLAFISALQAKKIQQSDMSSIPPVGMLWLLEGPTPDFMLGRVYEAAQDYALKDVFKTGEHVNSTEAQKTIAQNEFSKKNCRLIGLAK
jgi:hypothetical protein